MRVRRVVPLEAIEGPELASVNLDKILEVFKEKNNHILI